MSKKLTVAVVGATGAVGREMLKTLHERAFPATEIIPFASSRSAGTKVPFGDEELTVRELKEDVFDGIDLAIFSAGGGTSEKFAPHAAAAGRSPGGGGCDGPPVERRRIAGRIRARRAGALPRRADYGGRQMFGSAF